MLYLVAHLFLNGQLKKLNLFSVTRATREAIKKKPGALGTRMGKDRQKFLETSAFSNKNGYVWTGKNDACERNSISKNTINLET